MTAQLALFDEPVSQATTAETTSLFRRLMADVDQLYRQAAPAGIRPIAREELRAVADQQLRGAAAAARLLKGGARAMALHQVDAARGQWERLPKLNLAFDF